MKFEDLEVRHLVGELRQAEVFSVDPDVSLQTTMEMMNQENISAVVVKKGEKILGIVTERDFVRRGYLAGKDQHKSTVVDIMTPARKVKSVRLNTKIVEARREMRSQGMRHLLVIDKEGILLNILSGRDIRDAPDILHEIMQAPLDLQKELFETIRT